MPPFIVFFMAPIYLFIAMVWAVVAFVKIVFRISEVTQAKFDKSQTNALIGSLDPSVHHPMRVSMSLRQGTNTQFFVTRNYTFLDVIIELSARDKVQIDKKNLGINWFCEFDALTNGDARRAEKDHKMGGGDESKRKLFVYELLTTSNFTLPFREYQEAVQAMNNIKEGLQKLRIQLDHGADTPVKETFEI